MKRREHETSSNGYTFHVTGLLRGEFTGHPHKRPVTRTFDFIYDLCLNQHLRKQWRRRWFETPTRLLWRLSNETKTYRRRRQLIEVQCHIGICNLFRIANPCPFCWLYIIRRAYVCQTNCTLFLCAATLIPKNTTLGMILVVYVHNVTFLHSTLGAIHADFHRAL